NLKPEVANTTTVGFVITPTDLPGFNASLDYYKIVMRNAIGSVSANSVFIQELCESSGGTSVYCSLFHRPLPFSNTTAANFPTIVNSEELNTALTEIWGYDLEVGYRHAAPGGSLSG